MRFGLGAERLFALGGIDDLQTYLVLDLVGVEDHDGVPVRDAHHAPRERLGVRQREHEQQKANS
jgi:hypothetical protein